MPSGTAAPSGDSSRASVPGTGVPAEPARLAPGRLERTMKMVSVAPSPSRISTPKRARQLSYTSAGRRSPADTQARTERNVSGGSAARSIRA